MLRREVLDALELEIEVTAKAVQIKTIKVEAIDNLVHIFCDDDDNAIDESLEDATAWWGRGQQAKVLAADPESARLTLWHVEGAGPAAGSIVRVYKPKYLQKLHEIWEHPGRACAALKLLERLKERQTPVESVQNDLFPGLRYKQAEALNLVNRGVGFLWGPPGTGKTFTVGAIIANVLVNQPRARVLLLSSTNRAVDEALLSVDKRLQEAKCDRVIAESLRKRIKRYGSHFDAARYKLERREHLVVDPQRRELISKIAALEASEPSKSKTAEYAKWKEEITVLRARIPKPDLRAPLLAMTTTAAAFVFDHMETAPFDYVVFDEASQINLPYACALGLLGRRLIFAGDHKQLSPIVVSQHPIAQKVLGPSPFVHMRADNRCQLDEQNRMVPEICAIVADLFYEGNLRVVDGAEQNPLWRAERSVSKTPMLGRERLHIERCSTAGSFSSFGGAPGVYRPESAKKVIEIAKECTGPINLIAVVTPFRKQRREIQKLARAAGITNLKVSTIHSVQGGEYHTVIFDPVMGEPHRDGGKLLSDAREAPRLVNVALSRAKARFVLLLSASDRQNEVLGQLARAIEMKDSCDVEHVRIDELVLNSQFPTKHIGQYVSHGQFRGKLVSSDKPGHFGILGSDGFQRNFKTEQVLQLIQRRQP